MAAWASLPPVSVRDPHQRGVSWPLTAHAGGPRGVGTIFYGVACPCGGVYAAGDAAGLQGPMNSGFERLLSPLITAPFLSQECDP